MISNEILEVRRMQFEQNAAGAPPSEAARKLTASTIGVASVIGPAATAGAGEHTVQPGDTLSEIAETEATTVADIAATNSGVIEDVDMIFPGMRLDIPDATQSETPNSPHTVEKGESLWSIAAAHLGEGASDRAILQLMNKLKAGNDGRETIYPGQRIELPGVQEQNTKNVYVTRPNDSPWSIAQEIVGPAADAESRRRIRDVANQIIEMNGIEVVGRRAILDVSQELVLPEVSNQPLPESATDSQQTTVTSALEIQIPEPSQTNAEQLPEYDFSPLSDKVLRDWAIPTGEGTPYPDESAARAFINRVEEISAELGFSPDFLMAVMKFETGGSFDPAQQNLAGSGATGLIQCMERWCARPRGYTTSEVAAMTPIEQLDKIVYDYFKDAAGQLDSFFDVYLKVFYPQAIGKGPEHVIPLNSRGYRQNAGFDLNSNGQITVAEISSRVLQVFRDAPLLPPAQPEAPKNNKADTPPKVEDKEAETESSTDSTQVTATAEQAKPADALHPYVDLSSRSVNSDGVETIRLVDGEGRSFGDDISLEIANNAAGLLEAANNAGIRFYILSGARTVKEQEKLRAEHGCPGDLVYDRSCKGQPPTAVPGNSRHNQGTALDLRLGLEGDRKLTSGSPEFLWLVQNADDFGFYNLPSESWHWSIDGR